MNEQEYNEKLQAELARLNEYRQSLQEEYEKHQVDVTNERYKAKEIFQSSVERVANRIVQLATGAVSESVQIKAATYIYDRVIGVTDAPEEDEMQAMLDKLTKPIDVEEHSDIPESTRAADEDPKVTDAKAASKPSKSKEEQQYLADQGDVDKDIQ